MALQMKMEYDEKDTIRELTPAELDAVSGGKLAGAVHEIFNSGNDVFEKFTGPGVGTQFHDHNVFF